MTSILTSVKKNLSLAEDYEAFDADVITYINSTFGILNQIGVGPTAGFAIEDKSEEWEDFFAEGPILELVKTYTYLKVRILFDPPALSYHLTALEKQADEMIWRISVFRESDSWVDPLPVSEVGED